jgi:hypothetical protein
MRNALWAFLLIACCESPMVEIEPGAVQVGPTSQPALSVVIQPGAVVLSVDPGALDLDVPIAVNTPDLPEKAINRLSWWFGAAIAMVLVISLTSYPLQRWIRLRRKRRGR